MELKVSKNAMAFLFALIGVIMFSSKAVLVKLAYQHDVDALSLLSLRLLFALPVYVGVLINSLSSKAEMKIRTNDYLKVIVLGILGYYLASYLDFAGLNYISASLERLILFIYPTIVLLISALFFGKKASQAQKAAVLITYFGVILAFYKNTDVNGNNIFFGAFLIFISAVSYAAFLVGSGNLIPRLGPRLFTSFAMIVSSIAALIHFGIANGFNLFDFAHEVYIIAAIMAVVSTIIPSFLLAEAIKQLGASNVAIVGSFGPVSTIILAVIFLGESISVFQALGTLIVIGGVLILAKSKPQNFEPATKMKT
jgi:drug/metabolite transporter (DMT)-like permease